MQKYTIDNKKNITFLFTMQSSSIWDIGKEIQIKAQWVGWWHENWMEWLHFTMFQKHNIHRPWRLMHEWKAQRNGWLLFLGKWKKPHTTYSLHRQSGWLYCRVRVPTSSSWPPVESQRCPTMSQMNMKRAVATTTSLISGENNLN